MSSTDDFILLLHAPDGQHWSKFVSTRLLSPQYNINCISRDIVSAPTQSTANKETTEGDDSELYTNTNISQTTVSSPSHRPSINGNDKNNNTNASVGNPSSCRTSPKVADKESKGAGKGIIAGINRDSGRGSCARSTINKNSDITDCINSSRAVVVLLTPDIVESESPFPVDVTLFNRKTSVFLFLGVDIDEARTYFGEKSDVAFGCRLCVIDGTENTICEAMVQIIEAYEHTGTEGPGDEEDDDDIYQTMPSNRQMNNVEKVFPRQLTEEDREVFILLERTSEAEVTVELPKCKTNPSVNLECVCDRLYRFTVPAEVHGTVRFQLKCQEKQLGEEQYVMVPSKLDLIQSILEKEIQPLGLLSRALGLESQDLGGVDTALAFRLQQLAPVESFKNMFPCEDALVGSTSSDVRVDAIWPSLLHFAADFNLRTFCTELLRYPSMLAAACTENKHGEYPNQIASRNGFSQLESDLLQFVENHQKICDKDNDLYVEHLPPTTVIESSPPKASSPPPPAPKPHRFGSSSRGYVNDNALTTSSEFRAQSLRGDSISSFGENYIDMAGLQNLKMPILDPLDRCDSEVVSPVSKCSDSVFDNMSPVDVGSQDVEYHNLSALTCPDPFAIKKGASFHASESQGSSLSSPTDSPRDQTQDRSLSPDRDYLSDSSGGTSVKAMKILGVSPKDLSSGGLPVNPQRHYTLDGSISSSTKTKWFMRTTDLPRGSVSSNCDNPDMYLQHEQTSLTAEAGRRGGQGVMKEKMKRFLGKFKNKRSNSDGEIALTSHSIKKSLSNRSSNSSHSFKSDSSSKMKKSLSEETQERDSGSYSDEEKSKLSPMAGKRKQQRVFKEKDRPMTRRMSKRAQAAAAEKVDDAPTLPMRPPGKKRGAFKSFVNDS